jgi:predicted lipoprotein with Yx(FWY)xxD motif
MIKRIVLVMTLVVIAMLAAAPAMAQDMMPNTLNLGGEDSDLGPFIVAENGMTLYTFKRDTFGVSNCVDGCATNWPPYTVESADGLTVADGIPGEVGTIERADGTLQVTYNGLPLYFWVNDAETGDANGHNFRTAWLVVQPATVYAVPNAEHGFMLVGERGFTLYTFANDEAGVSNCVDNCATNWPPLTVADANALRTSINLPGIFGTIERADGTLQVTYNGDPLYYWVQDAARGDATGHLRGDVWFVALP